MVLVLFSALKLFTKGYLIQDPQKKEYASLLLLGIISLYMGLRPISYVFGDMGTYAKYFEEFANGAQIVNKKDYLWRLFMKFCSGIMTAQYFFLLCAILYVVPLYPLLLDPFDCPIKETLFELPACSLTLTQTPAIYAFVESTVIDPPPKARSLVILTDGLLISVTCPCG